MASHPLSKSRSTSLRNSFDISPHLSQRFILRDRVISPVSQPDDDATEAGHTKPSLPGPVTTEETRESVYDESGEAPSKRVKLSGAQKKKLARSEAKGMNKNRHFMHVSDKVEICWRFVNGERCPGGSGYGICVWTQVFCNQHSPFCTSCRFSHDLGAYLDTKPKDLFWPSETPTFSTSVPFAPEHTFAASRLGPSIDAQTSCPIFLRLGDCRYGLKCRFLGGHVKAADPNENSGIPVEVVKVDCPSPPEEINFVHNSTLKELRSRKVPYTCSDGLRQPLITFLGSFQLQFQTHTCASSSRRRNPVQLPLVIPPYRLPDLRRDHRCAKSRRRTTPLMCLYGLVKKNVFSGEGKHVRLKNAEY